MRRRAAAVASGSTRSGSCVATTIARSARLGERRVEQRRAGRVERVERLVEDQELRLVEEHAAEPEPLAHAAREGRDALVAHLPEPEALEQHADALAALGHAVERREQMQVLERRQLAVDERLVAEVADRPRGGAASSSPPLGAASPARTRSSVVLPEPFGPVTSRNPGRAELDVDAVRRCACRRSASTGCCALQQRAG